MKNTSFKIIQIVSITILFIVLSVVMAEAQCPMCRMSAETNLNDGGTAAAGLNKGIIYLLIIPYVLVSLIGYMWWNNRKMIQEEEQEDEIRSLLEPHQVVISKTEFNEKVGQD